MAGRAVSVSAPLGEGCVVLTRWRVRRGGVVGAGQLLAEWKRQGSAGAGQSGAAGRLRAPLPGTVARLAAEEGDLLQPGQTVLEIEACSHPTVMRDMCADCGADLRCDDRPQANIASVPMVHTVPDLKVSEELAQKIGREDRERLLRDRKLVLLVDLDQTLIHTTNDNIPANLKDVYHFRLRSWGPGGYGGGRWYHTRLRPGTLKFLRAVTKFFELHICTFGARAYAHQVAELLDPNGELFSHRILSRDECFDIHTKTPNLRALFPCGDNLVCIIDDREDVWNRASNLIQVKPYHFFEHTGDINAPPGLEKTERDIEGQGVHLDDLKVNKNKESEKKEKAKSKTIESVKSELIENENPESNGNTEIETKEKEWPESKDDKNPELIENLEPELKENSESVSKDNTKLKPKKNSESVPSETTKPELMENSESKAIEIGEPEEINEKENCKPAEEMPSLEMEGIETSPNPTKEINRGLTETINTIFPTKIDENNKYHVIQSDDDDYKPIEPTDSHIDSEKAIVKDIEKIVSQVQENFISSDLTSIKMDAESQINDTDDKENLIKINNTECDSTTSSIEANENNQQIQPPQTRWKLTEEGLIDIEDSDDYLLYLEEILKRIHKLFYELYDTMEAGSVPDLKAVIPQVKSQVLAGTSLVFSGLVPTHQKLEHSRAYMVAQSLGAEVTQDFTERTTHLVAVRPGTAKVHACRRVSTGGTGATPYTVTPAWLWCCAERWQHVEEKLFPLRGGTGRLPRRPPPHCGSPPRVPQNHNATPRRRTPSGRFMDTINPLLSFSTDDIADMDKEVEDIINESDESDSDDKVFLNNENSEDRILDNTLSDEDSQNILRDDLGNISSGSESAESLSGGEHPHGWKPDRPHKRRRSRSSISAFDDPDSEPSKPKQTRNNELSLRGTEDETQDTSCDEFPSERFKRGEALPSDGPDQNDSDSDGSVDPPDDMDDGDWNMMGAALEREFLGLDK